MPFCKIGLEIQASRVDVIEGAEMTLWAATASEGELIVTGDEGEGEGFLIWQESGDTFPLFGREVENRPSNSPSEVSLRQSSWSSHRKNASLSVIRDISALKGEPGNYPRVLEPYVNSPPVA